MIALFRWIGDALFFLFKLDAIAGTPEIQRRLCLGAKPNDVIRITQKAISEREVRDPVCVNEPILPFLCYGFALISSRLQRWML
jgi:hypothetical protein